MAGAISGLAVTLLMVELTAGLANYRHWTLQFATSRRLPPLADMLAIYEDDLLPWWMVTAAGGALLLCLNREAGRALPLLSAILMSVPFIWTLISLFGAETSERSADRLLALWPFLLSISSVVALGRLWSERRHPRLMLVLPFILIGTVHGAFLSQQVWGSTYALWPLLMLLIGSTTTVLVSAPREWSSWWMVPFTSLLSMSMLLAGGHYVWTHERLDYAKLAEGTVTHSTLPALAGLSISGPWIPDFEELVRFAEHKIPREDGLLMIPGEDLFYFTSGRQPRFPVVMFDHTVNPYSPDEIRALSRARGIWWLIIKKNLQLKDEPVEKKEQVLALLRRDFSLVARLENYEVYHLR
jgi:hypothetical protein